MKIMSNPQSKNKREKEKVISTHIWPMVTVLTFPFSSTFYSLSLIKKNLFLLHHSLIHGQIKGSTFIMITFSFPYSHGPSHQLLF